MSKENNSLYNPFANLKLETKDLEKPKEIKPTKFTGIKAVKPLKPMKTANPVLESPDDIELEEENNLFLAQMSRVQKIKSPKKEVLDFQWQEQKPERENGLDFSMVEFFKPKQEKAKPEPPKPKPKQTKEVFIHSTEQTKEGFDGLDDASDFLKAVTDVKSLQNKGREVLPEIKPEVSKVNNCNNPMQDFMDGKLEFSIHSTDQYVEGHVLGLDLMTLAKLQARQYSPEAHIDLHGLNSEQAYNNLIGFFRNSYHRGLRTVLVVTGKGRNSFDGTPILRAKVQEWFTKEPFKRVILAFCSAKIEDGGAGALYVLIRKRKKEYGKIQWDVSPVDPDLFL